MRAACAGLSSKDGIKYFSCTLPKTIEKSEDYERYYTGVLALCRVSGLLWNNSWNMKGLWLLAISPECL